MTLTTDQEHEIRAIAKEEAQKMMAALAMEIARTPKRADMNMNQRDLHACVTDAAFGTDTPMGPRAV